MGGWMSVALVEWVADPGLRPELFSIAQPGCPTPVSKRLKRARVVDRYAFVCI